MTEKMTDRQINALESHNEDDGVEAEQVARLISETRRARRLEQEQASKIAEQEQTIEALAESVLRNGFWVDGGRDWHSRRCPQSLPPAGAPCTCADDRLALRRAGRLP